MDEDNEGLVADLAEDLAIAKGNANIDGYGDEGAGYDFEKMAREILSRYDVTPKF